MTTSADLDRRARRTSTPASGPRFPVEQEPAAPSRRRLALAAAAASALGLTVAAVVGGAGAAPLLADPGLVSRWGLLAVRAGYDLAAMATIGVLVVAVVLLTAAGALSADGERLVRLAGRWSAAWSVAAALSVTLVLSDVTGTPVWQVLSPDVLPLAADLPQTRALASSAWLAALVAVGSRRCSSVVMGRLLLVTAIGGLLPPLLTGHSGHTGDQYLTAVVGLATHVTAACVWLGGLLALGVHLRSADLLRVALPRYSRVALACFVMVGGTGLVLGWLALSAPGELVGTPYGRLLLGKTAALGILGLVGHRHRRRTLSAIAARRPRAFLALAAVELVVMAATVGLAVGLSRTAPPEGGEHAAAVTSGVPAASPDLRLAGSLRL